MSSADPIARGDALTIHPAADIFPVMDAEAFAKLAEDIRVNGLQEAIWISQEGAILDGRHRYRACQETGVRPRFKFFEGDDPIAFVLSMNLHRRHLSDDQRAMVAARVANLKRGRPEENRPSGRFSQVEAAESLNVSERSVRRARIVRTQGIPELQAEVDRGGLAVATAERIARLPAEDQQKIVAIGDPAARRAAVKDARKPKRETIDLAVALDAPPEADHTLFWPILEAMEALTSHLAGRNPEWMAREFHRRFPYHKTEYVKKLQAAMEPACVLLSEIHQRSKRRE